jgi:hypothetical protein
MNENGIRTSIALNKELKTLLPKYISRWGGQTRAITATIKSLDEMFRIEHRMLKQLFTTGEMSLMLNKSKSKTYKPELIPNIVLYDTEDEIDAKFEFYGVSRDELVGKLKGLTLSQQYALVDWLVEQRGDTAQTSGE